MYKHLFLWVLCLVGCATEAVEFTPNGGILCFRATEDGPLVSLSDELPELTPETTLKFTSTTSAHFDHLFGVLGEKLKKCASVVFWQCEDTLAFNDVELTELSIYRSPELLKTLLEQGGLAGKISLTSLTLHGDGSVDALTKAFTKQLENIEKLDVWDYFGDWTQLKEDSGTFMKPKIIRLCGNGAAQAFLKILPNTHNIEELKLLDNSSGFEGWSLVSLPALRNIDLSGNGASRALTQITDLNCLEEVRVVDNSNVFEEWSQMSFPVLKKLELSGSGAVKRFTQLSGMENIEELKLEDYASDIHEWSQLTLPKGLKKVYFKGWGVKKAFPLMRSTAALEEIIIKDKSENCG